MARIAGVDLPRNKRIEIALTYIFGIGRHAANIVLNQPPVSRRTRSSDDLDENDVRKIRDAIEANYRVEGDLRRDVQFDIKRLMELDCYRGTRHRRNLPSRGQRTHTNARTRKGPRRMAVKKWARSQMISSASLTRRVGGAIQMSPKRSRRRRSGRTSRPASRTSARRSTTPSSRSPTSAVTSSRGRRLERAASRARASRPRSRRSSPPRTPPRRRWSTASATSPSTSTARAQDASRRCARSTRRGSRST